MRKSAESGQKATSRLCFKVRAARSVPGRRNSNSTWITLLKVGRRPCAGSIEQHREPSRSAHGPFRPFDLDRGVETEFRDPCQPLLERNIDFHARQIRADAAVNTETERGMRIPCPVNDNAVRVGKLVG